MVALAQQCEVPADRLAASEGSPNREVALKRRRKARVSQESDEEKAKWAVELSDAASYIDLPTNDLLGASVSAHIGVYPLALTVVPY